jgi:hypothetical protein
MSNPKEPHYFGSNRQRIVPAVRDEAAYLALFERATEPVVGEATPVYLLHAEVPELIRQRVPDAKIVISLREPGERARSAYAHLARYGRAKSSFAEAVAEELRRPWEERGLYAFSYAETVGRYVDNFEHVHVLFLEELEADVRGELRRLYDFLGVDPAFAERADTSALNRFGLPRNRLVGRLYRSQRWRSVARRIVPTALQPRLERLVLTGARSDTDQETVARLRAEYVDDLNRLEGLLGRSLPWKREQ